MARRRPGAARRAPALLLACALGLGACAPPEVPDPEARTGPPPRFALDAHFSWTPEDAWNGTTRGLERTSPLPWAVNGIEYRRERWEGRHVVVDLMVEAASEEPQAVDARALRAQVAELEASIGAPVPVMLRAPQRTAWSTVARVLSSLASEEVGTQQIQIELRQDFQVARRMDLGLIEPAEPESASASVRLTRTVRARNRWVSLEAGGSRFEFPVDDGVFDRPESLDFSAHRFFDVVWWKVQQLLTETRAGGRAAGVAVDETDGPVELAYVVSLLDVLIDAGYRTVAFPEERIAFAVEPAPPQARTVPQPALPHWVLVASALAVVLAFVLTLASVGRSPRRRPSAPGRGRSRPGR